MAAPKLEWTRYTNTDGNSRYGANIPGSCVYRYRVVGKYESDTIRFDVYDTTERQDRLIRVGFPTTDEAQAWCQAREDEAWLAANPPREYSDTELWDAVESNDLLFAWNGRSSIVCWPRLRADETYFGQTRREAVTAYLRANPPAAKDEGADESEPATEREMSFEDFRTQCLSRSLNFQISSNRDADQCVNVWPSGMDLVGDIDAYAPTLREAFEKCVAAIEAAKSPAAQQEAAR